MAGRARATPESLPDFLAPHLRLLCVGLNPSLPAARAGFHYANPRNRFWPAVRAAGLVPADLEPSPAAMRWLLEHARIGFTDVVSRPTAGGAALRAADFRRDAPRLTAKLEHLRPSVVWFVGLQTYRAWLTHGIGVREPVSPGVQSRRVADATIVVTPSPSPANAAVSLDALTEWARMVGRLLP
ncbi:MAG: mismatch-specific DNA-glycosylase [Ectothiorhodospiraceae bacterium]|nr:mismatch-specific DNA-glycosylase [Chromatiales bacterium]MCP5157543.1 mismatch-specific DNA-glycosylase [Ectothiorhodospiraceae bacterium]